MEHLIYKSFDAITKDVDVKRRIVEGYFSTWGIVDADNDELMPGAYAKSIKENGPGAVKPRIMHLWQHSAKHPMYRFVEDESLVEDQKGLFFRSKITSTTYGKDALLLYEDGVISEHSVGIQTVKTQKASEGHNQITETRLWEGSSVTWGSNWDTPVTDMKSMSKEEVTAAAEKFNNRIEVLSKALRDGTYTDDTFILLEIQLKQIQGHYESLIKSIQPGPPTGGDEPIEIGNLDEVINLLKFE